MLLEVDGQPLEGLAEAVPSRAARVGSGDKQLNAAGERETWLGLGSGRGSNSMCLFNELWTLAAVEPASGAD